MGDVKQYANSKPNYNLLACAKPNGNQANCQMLAAHLYEKLVGHEPKTSSCGALCPSACKHSRGMLDL
jgi:hypothetical protein